MKRYRDLSQLTFGVTGYEENIKAFSQTYNPRLNGAPADNTCNYKIRNIYAC